jgi:hypothetical protein
VGPVDHYLHAIAITDREVVNAFVVAAIGSA